MTEQSGSTDLAEETEGMLTRDGQSFRSLRLGQSLQLCSRPRFREALPLLLAARRHTGLPNSEPFRLE